ncbi:MAG: hypothetical protein K5894_14360 [Lachnospiraceae bacterium]|nr:hypothetical protein [Lachnospiraceae bacterium]
MDLMTKKFYSLLTGGIISSIVTAFVLVSDVVVAGILLGDDAVAGMNLVTPAYSFAASLAALLSIGTPILYSKALGNFEGEKATRLFRTGLTAAVGCGMILFLVFLILGDDYISSFQAAPIILESAGIYLFWIRIVIFFLPFSIFLSGMVMADGDETLSLIADIASSGVNILLSVILGRIMGVTGIGVSSLIGTLLGVIICLFHFAKKRNSLSPGFYFSGRMILSISHYGIVDAASYLFLSAFSALITLYISFYFGSELLILSSVFTLVIEMQFLLDGIGEALPPTMSIYLATGSFEGVMKIWKEAKKMAIILGLIFALILAVFAPFIPELLGISNQNIADMAIVGVRILSVSMPFISLLYLITSYTILIKRITFGVMTTALYKFILAITFAVILGFTFGIYGVFAGVTIAPVVTWFAIKYYVKWKEGKESWPLRLHDVINTKTYLFDFVIEPGSIIDTQAKIEKTLSSNNIPKSALSRCSFLFEELYMEIYDKNGKKAVNGECILSLTDDLLQLIDIDDGIIFNMDEEVEELSSFREYVLSRGFVDWTGSLEYLKAISFNRNRIEISLKNEDEQ